MNKRIDKNWLLLVTAVLIGLCAAYLGNEAVQDRMAQLDEEAQRGQEMVEVVVANRDLGQGDILGAEVLAVRKIPKQFSHASAISAAGFADIEKARLQVPIKRGEALLQAHIEGLGQRVFSSILQRGMRALTFEVDEISSTAGMLRPGDRVDLIYAVKAASATTPEERFVFPLLSNVNILATGQSVTKQDARGAERRYTSVTMEVSPADANRILLARASGEVTAILRNPDDQMPNDSPVLTPEVLLATLDRKPAVTVAPVMAPSIEFMVGGGGGGGGGGGNDLGRLSSQP